MIVELKMYLISKNGKSLQQANIYEAVLGFDVGRWPNLTSQLFDVSHLTYCCSAR